ncbi:MAG: sigma-70 family RNA polymerase sigma factor [Gammaproteobacteria bacterium]|nr:sigma-70 family RNA polymerase sigma factor [Gammaproteobacteria bacterium]MBU1644802.1 sigma-70 family RNA polymerase sigma factor [Gammaproteobacteria bacterium]MBU1973035.1 sigma-70 family RNA polymerase sigma factor [Gammaproteobacteria bacterium]
MTPDELSAQLHELQPRLVRFARMQLRDDSAADDAVQEALLAALENARSFDGAAAAATWVFAILKNKLIDEFRRRSRNPVVDVDAEVALGEQLDEQFDARGHWLTPPSAWSDPGASLEQKRFWEVFEVCISGLPERPARVFGMRELLGMETEEICKELGISTSNCWVLLHRARLGLRDCLSRRWFGED